MKLKLMILQFTQLLLFFAACVFASEEDERDDAIAALFSLRCHIAQLKENSLPEEAIAFSYEDVQALWDQAERCQKFKGRIEEIHTLYSLAYHASFPDLLDDIQLRLTSIWQELAAYPNFDGNPLFSTEMHQRIAPHLLPLNHPMKPMLDALFLNSRPTETPESFAQAGFITLFAKNNTYVYIARHPLVPGYLFKLHLDSELREKAEMPGWYWLTNRCEGAANIRRLIKRKKIKHFSVPDKWIYPLPYNGRPNAKPFVLLVKDMDIVSHSKSQEAWKKAKASVVRELYTILSHGYGSWFLTGNVPKRKNGQFAFVDTEYPKRKINLKRVGKYLSPEMQVYWEWLVIAGGKFEK